MVLEKTLESPWDCKEIQPVHPKGNQPLIFIRRTDAEAETNILVSRKVSQGRGVWVKQAPVGLRRHREPDNSCHFGRLWQFAHPRPLSLLQRGLAPRSKGKEHRHYW